MLENNLDQHFLMMEIWWKLVSQQKIILFFWEN